MVEISKSGSGEGSVWVTGRGYSTGDSPFIFIAGGFPTGVLMGLSILFHKQ